MHVVKTYPSTADDETESHDKRVAHLVNFEARDRLLFEFRIRGPFVAAVDEQEGNSGHEPKAGQGDGREVHQGL